MVEIRYARIWALRKGQPPYPINLRIDSAADGSFIEPPEALYNAAQVMPSLDAEIQGAKLEGWEWIDFNDSEPPIYYVGTGQPMKGK